MAPCRESDCGGARTRCGSRRDTHGFQKKRGNHNNGAAAETQGVSQTGLMSVIVMFVAPIQSNENKMSCRERGRAPLQVEESKSRESGYRAGSRSARSFMFLAITVWQPHRLKKVANTV